MHFCIFGGKVFVLSIKHFTKQTGQLLFKSLLLHPVSLFELKFINFCRILAIGPGHRKGLKCLKLIWLGKNAFLGLGGRHSSLCVWKHSWAHFFPVFRGSTGSGLREGAASRSCGPSACSTVEVLHPPERPWSSPPTAASSLSCSAGRCRAFTLAPANRAAALHLKNILIA